MTLDISAEVGTRYSFHVRLCLPRVWQSYGRFTSWPQW
jgi:hypothetical protein